jgi:hypothetical protein
MVMRSFNGESSIIILMDGSVIHRRSTTTTENPPRSPTPTQESFLSPRSQQPHNVHTVASITTNTILPSTTTTTTTATATAATAATAASTNGSPTSLDGIRQEQYYEQEQQDQEQVGRKLLQPRGKTEKVASLYRKISTEPLPVEPTTVAAFFISGNGLTPQTQQQQPHQKNEQQDVGVLKDGIDKTTMRTTVTGTTNRHTPTNKTWSNARMMPPQSPKKAMTTTRMLPTINDTTTPATTPGTASGERMMTLQPSDRVSPARASNREMDKHDALMSATRGLGMTTPTTTTTTSRNSGWGLQLSPTGLRGKSTQRTSLPSDRNVNWRYDHPGVKEASIPMPIGVVAMSAGRGRGGGGGSSVSSTRIATTMDSSRCSQPDRMINSNHNNNNAIVDDGGVDSGRASTTGAIFILNDGSYISREPGILTRHPVVVGVGGATSGGSSSVTLPTSTTTTIASGGPPSQQCLNSNDDGGVLSELNGVVVPQPNPPNRFFLMPHEQVDHDVGQRKRQSSRRSLVVVWTVLLVVVLVIAGVVTGVLVNSGRNTKDSPPPADVSLGGNDTDINKDDLEFVERLAITRQWILDAALTSPYDLDVPGSPQNMALQWLASSDDDTLSLKDSLSSFGDNGLVLKEEKEDEKIRMTAYYCMTVLYYALNGPQWRHQQGWLNRTIGVCDWDFVNCSNSGSGRAADADANGSLEVNTVGPMPGNSLRGKVPSELQHLSQLREYEIVLSFFPNV